MIDPKYDTLGSWNFIITLILEIICLAWRSSDGDDSSSVSLFSLKVQK